MNSPALICACGAAPPAVGVDTGTCGIGLPQQFFRVGGETRQVLVFISVFVNSCAGAQTLHDELGLVGHASVLAGGLCPASEDATATVGSVGVVVGPVAGGFVGSIGPRVGSKEAASKVGVDVGGTALVATSIGDGYDLSGAREAEAAFPGVADIHHVGAGGLVVEEAGIEFGLDPFNVGPGGDFVNLDIGEVGDGRGSVEAWKSLADNCWEGFEAGAEVGGAVITGKEGADLHPAGRRNIGVNGGFRVGRSVWGAPGPNGFVFFLPFTDPENTFVGGNGFHFGRGGPDEVGVFRQVAADLGGGFKPGAPLFGNGRPELDDVGGAGNGGSFEFALAGCLLRHFRLQDSRSGLRLRVGSVNGSPLKKQWFRADCRGDTSQQSQGG